MAFSTLYNKYVKVLTKRFKFKFYLLFCLRSHSEGPMRSCWRCSPQWVGRAPGAQ